MAGLTHQITAAQINTSIGVIARDVNVALERVQAAARFFRQNTDAELVAGYQMTAGDAAQLRTAVEALDLLRDIYTGKEALAASRNFQRDVNPIIGLGFL
jgi:hypothetical protein